MQEFNQAYEEKEKQDEDAKEDAKAKGQSEPDSNNAINKMSALPNFTSLLGKNILLPQIELNGMTNFNTHDSFYGDIKIFTSAFALKSFSNLSLFFPETSVYGISMSFNWLPFKKVNFIKANGEKQEVEWFCAYFKANYLGKNLQGISEDDKTVGDTLRFTSDVAHLKLGLQVIPITNILSFYGDINFLLPVVNRDPLLKYNTDMKRGSNNFITLGTRFFIANGADKPLNIYLDFSAVVVDKVTKTMYKTNDALIPRLSVGGSFKF
ncbi:hypothetical protein GCM10028803_30500 [Larkinella knui]